MAAFGSPVVPLVIAYTASWFWTDSPSSNAFGQSSSASIKSVRQSWHSGTGGSSEDPIEKIFGTSRPDRDAASIIGLIQLAWARMIFGFVSSRCRSSSEEWYEGLVPETQPPAPRIASHIRGYQIYHRPRFPLSDLLHNRREVEAESLRFKRTNKRRFLTLLPACRHTQSPFLTPSPLRPLMS